MNRAPALPRIESTGLWRVEEFLVVQLSVASQESHRQAELVLSNLAPRETARALIGAVLETYIGAQVAFGMDPLLDTDAI